MKHLFVIIGVLISMSVFAQTPSWRDETVTTYTTPMPARDSIFAIQAHSRVDAQHGEGHLYPISSGGGFANPMSAGGDIIYGGASGTPTRLANGSANSYLTSNGTTLAPTWTVQPKRYVALLTQTGTNAPVATVLENSLGTVPTYAYTTTGFFSIVCNNCFTLNKTTMELGNEFGSTHRYTSALEDTAGSDDEWFFTSSNSGIAENGSMNGAMIRITVYP